MSCSVSTAMSRLVRSSFKFDAEHHLILFIHCFSESGRSYVCIYIIIYNYIYIYIYIYLYSILLDHLYTIHMTCSCRTSFPRSIAMRPSERCRKCPRRRPATRYLRVTLKHRGNKKWLEKSRDELTTLMCREIG